MAVKSGSEKPARLVCLCGQRMAIQESMYGQPGKCPACRRKLWMPYAEEVAAFGPVIHVAQHREFLREPGQRARALVEKPISDDAPAEAAEPADRARADVAPPGPQGRPGAPVPAEAAHPTPVPQGDKEDSPPEVPLSSPGPLPSKQPAAREGSVPASAEVLREEPAQSFAAPESETSSTHAAGPEDRPVDPQPALQVILSAIAHCEARLAHLRKDPATSPEDLELLESWLRLARAARWKLDREFRSALVETSDALRATLKDIGKTVARFRSGSLTPDEFFEKIAALRERREVLERKRVNLRGWLRAELPEDVGGSVHRDWGEVDFDLIRPEWPAGPSGRGSLLSWITDNLREALRATREAETEEEQWRHAPVREGDTDLAVRESGIRDARCVRRMAMDRVEFLRHRLREILMDIHTDIEALNDYGRVAVEKAGGPDSDTARAIAERLAAAVADLRKQRAWARDALAALFPEEVPGGPVTLFRNLGAPEGRQRFSLEMLPALLAAFLFMVLAGVAESWLFSGFFAGVGLLVVPALLLRTLRLRAGGILALWGVSSIPVGMVVLRGLQHAAPGALPPLMGMCGWLSLGVLLWVVLRGMPGQMVRFVASATLVLALLAVGVVVQGLAASSPVRATGKSTETSPGRAATVPVSGGPAQKTGTDREKWSSPSENPRPVDGPLVPPGPVASQPAPGQPSVPPRDQAREAIPTEKPPATETEPAAPAPSPESAPTPSAPLVTGVTAELRGILRTENRPPRFKVIFRSATGEQVVDALLGERMYGLWTAREFNDEDASLTLTNGGRYVILKKGVPVELPDAP
ncbi:MAG TPA: hypothetical protein PK349_07290 [Candidatus Hydrogenedentes bacterium]|nr:hypothetical protein [Candidatus Hydrogenedentota bacterium]